MTFLQQEILLVSGTYWIPSLVSFFINYPPFSRITSKTGWLSSRVVSVLDSGAEGPWFAVVTGARFSKLLSGNSLRQTVHTHCASVHQPAKLVAALLRVAGVTAGLVESNGSLPPGLWLTSPAGWLPRTGISSRTLRWVIEYGLPFYFKNYARSIRYIATPGARRFTG